jgi:hypothetical protein
MASLCLAVNLRDKKPYLFEFCYRSIWTVEFLTIRLWESRAGVLPGVASPSHSPLRKAAKPHNTQLRQERFFSATKGIFDVEETAIAIVNLFSRC